MNTMLALLLSLAASPALAQEGAVRAQSELRISASAPKAALYFDEADAIFGKRIAAGKMSPEKAADEYARWIERGYLTAQDIDGLVQRLVSASPQSSSVRGLDARLKKIRPGTTKLTLQVAAEEYARWVKLGYITYEEMDSTLRAAVSKRVLTDPQAAALQGHLRTLVR